MPQVGITEDGKSVIGGVYEFHETYGMPLQALFSWLADRNMVPDWIDFYHWANNNGMRHERIISKIRDPLEDAWGVDFANAICDTLDAYYETTLLQRQHILRLLKNRLDI